MNKTLLKTSLLAAILVIVFSNPIMLLVKTWWVRTDYSHGFLIPFVSLFMAWSSRDRLARLPVRPNLPAGIPFTIAGCLVLVLGAVGGTSLIQQSSIVVILPGLVLLLFGTAYLRVLMLPLSYLILMVPVFDLVSGSVHWYAQLFSAAIGSLTLKVVGIPVFHNLQYLELPTTTLEVARECSGVNFLLSIIAVGVPLSYFTQKAMWKKLLLVVMALFVGILANGLRVALIGVWVYNGGTVVHGPLHMFQGLFVSIVGFIFLFIAAWALNKIPSSKQKRKPPEDMPVRSGSSDSKLFNSAWIIAVAILMLNGAFILQYRPNPVSLKQGLRMFPLQIDEWTGTIQKDSHKMDGADSEIVVLYRNPAGHKISLYIGYFASQSQNKKIIGYSQLDLYKKNTEIMVVESGSGEKVQINKTAIKENGRETKLFYWYDVNGKVTASKYVAKLTTTMQGILHSRTNGSIIEISDHPSTTDEEWPEAYQEDTIRFIRNLLPVLRAYLA